MAAHEGLVPLPAAQPTAVPSPRRDRDRVARAQPAATRSIAASTPPALAFLPRDGGTRIDDPGKSPTGDWEHLLRHGLGIEALRCPRCSATMRPIAAVTEPSQVRRLLLHLGEPLRGDVPTRAWDPVPCEWDEPAPPDDWA